MRALERPTCALMIEAAGVFKSLCGVTLRAGDPLENSSRVWVFMTTLTSTDVDGAKGLELACRGPLDVTL